LPTPIPENIPFHFPQQKQITHIVITSIVSPEIQIC
jgi:hypothetical protein